MAEVMRFGAVGLATNLVGYAAYLIITAAGVMPMLAVTILFSMGTVVSFLGNRTYTFRKSSAQKRAGLKYATVYFLGYILNLSILFVFVDRVGLPHQAVQAAAILIVAVVLFVLSKWYVFSNGSGEGKTSQ